jgi:hypothetical protein
LSSASPHTNSESRASARVNTALCARRSLPETMLAGYADASCFCRLTIRSVPLSAVIGMPRSRLLAPSARAPHTGVGASTLDLLERCYEAHEAQPSAEELRRFARANRIPYQPDRARSWNECVEAWKQLR